MNPQRPQPRARAAKPLRAVVRAGALAWALGAALPGEVAAQDATTPARLELSLGATSYLGDASAEAGGAALIGLTDRISLGGTGSLLLGSRTLEGASAGNDVSLRAAFGGVLAQFRISGDGERELWIRLTAGAGNAKQELVVAGSRIAADNFGVVFPEVGGSRRVAGPLHLGVAVGYRATFGVENLPGVSSTDLRGPSARVLASLRRF